MSDAELLRSLHDEHAGALWAFTVRLLDGDRGRAQDVVQETFLRAWRNPKVLDRQDGSVRSWLFTVARHLVVDDWRRSRRRRELLAAEPVEAVTAAEDDRVLDRAVVAAALRSLSEQHRQVVVACYLQGLSVTEAAEVLGVPAGTVKSRCHYALRAMREALQERQDGEHGR